MAKHGKKATEDFLEELWDHYEDLHGALDSMSIEDHEWFVNRSKEFFAEVKRRLKKLEKLKEQLSG